MSWTWELLIVAVAFAVFAIPIGRILARLGYSPWLLVLAFIPVVNLITLWVLAYAQWPADRR